MMTNDVDDYLEHFGVIGMKWGRRKGSSSSSKKVSTSKKGNRKVKAATKIKNTTKKPSGDSSKWQKKIETFNKRTAKMKKIKNTYEIKIAVAKAFNMTQTARELETDKTIDLVYAAFGWDDK